MNGMLKGDELSPWLPGEIVQLPCGVPWRMNPLSSTRVQAQADVDLERRWSQCRQTSPSLLFKPKGNHCWPKQQESENPDSSEPSALTVVQ